MEMAEGRPAIPAQLRRDVLVEAGHRCAIPTCRSVPVQINHIDDWAKVKEHTFDNLIALCGTCHDRYTYGQIDRLSMKQYKANLGLITKRYNDFEVRLLEMFIPATQNDNPLDLAIQIPGGMHFMLWYLLRDEMIEEVEINTLGIGFGGIEMPLQAAYRMTPGGLQLVQRLAAGQSLD